MQKELLKNMVIQNQITSSYSFNRITEENTRLRLTKTAASVGFIYRHIGECINLFCQFFGVQTEIKNTTIGKTDEGQGKNIIESHTLIEEGFVKLYQLIETQPDDYWLGDIDTPFFGTVARVRLFAHILYHNSHHAGQISMTLARGNNFA